MSRLTLPRPDRHPTIHLVPPAHPFRSAVFWVLFAAAAVVFALDATASVHVAAMRPLAVEANPIARWTLEVHPAAPFVLKAAVVAQCIVIAAILRAIHERTWAFGVVAMMAVVGMTGIATAFEAIRT